MRNPKTIIGGALVIVFGALVATYSRAALVFGLVLLVGVFGLVVWREWFGQKHWAAASSVLVGAIVLSVVGSVWWFGFSPRFQSDTLPNDSSSTPAQVATGTRSSPTSSAESTETAKRRLPAPRNAPGIHLQSGDMLVVDETSLRLVNPEDGSQTAVIAGGFLSTPRGIAIEQSGQLLVTDPGAFRGEGAVLSIDSVSGEQVEVAAGFEYPIGIAIERSGTILVADANAGNVIRIDRATGRQEMLAPAAGGILRSPRGIAIADSGEIFVADDQGQIVHIDPATGEHTLVTAGDLLQAPMALTLSPQGALFVSDAEARGGNGAVIRVDPETGTQTLVSEAGSFMNPYGIVWTETGDLLVVESSAFEGRGALILVDPVSGSQNVQAFEGASRGPMAIAVAR